MPARHGIVMPVKTGYPAHNQVGFTAMHTLRPNTIRVMKLDFKVFC